MTMTASHDIPMKNKGSILLMDDDPVIRAAIQGLLESIGYRVAVCRDGMETIDAYMKALQNGCPFDAVIMDLNIPGGMGGKETMQELLVQDPRAKGIVSSGYPDDVVMSDFKRFGFCGVVEKPYKIEDLDALLISLINR